MWEAFGAMMGGSAPAIMAFCAFNLLCAPCFAAIGTIRRQMASAKWTWFAIGYMTVFAYAVALMIYQFGMFFSTGSFTIATAFAVMFWRACCSRFSGPCRASRINARRTSASFPLTERISESCERVYRFGSCRRYCVRVSFHPFLSQERHVRMQGTLRVVRSGSCSACSSASHSASSSESSPAHSMVEAMKRDVEGELEDFVRFLSSRSGPSVIPIRSAKLCDGRFAQSAVIRVPASHLSGAGFFVRYDMV
ncbi:MAG: hypothetical protein ACLT98_05765 [Eggerthellaceae bacterium]